MINYFEKIKLESLRIASESRTEQLSDYHKKILNTINDEQFGCQTKNVISFASAYCGIDFSKFIDSHEHFEHGTVINIPPGQEPYPEGLACIFYGKYAFSAVSFDHHGSKIHRNSNVRIASKEEVEQFYDIISKKPEYFLRLFRENSKIKDDLD